MLLDLSLVWLHDSSSVSGQEPRLSKANLFTLLSLWMELFPKKEACQRENDPVGIF